MEPLGGLNTDVDDLDKCLDLVENCKLQHRSYSNVSNILNEVTLIFNEVTSMSTYSASLRALEFLLDPYMISLCIAMTGTFGPGLLTVAPDVR